MYPRKWNSTKDPLRGTVTFLNGEVIEAGDVVGDISEQDMRRIQIRETILSHFEKEEKLFNMGIKCLSLFFIDEVAKYRQYDEDGNEILGEYGKIFEQEYINVLNEYINIFDTPYQKYLKSTCSDVSAVHNGYFSIDKKGHAIDSKLKRGSEFSDDISAYDLILKNKERLLSFDEPTRFIFSHSALREGWDNPNVFQICTLKHSDSNTGKRQEVGRGLRLCVNQDGNRMDVETCGEAVHDINILTVIASESYKTFVTDLQSDIKSVLYDRPTVATSEFFKGKYVKVDEIPVLIDDNAANAIEFYLIQNGYVDMKRRVTDKYRQDINLGMAAELPDELKPMAEGIHLLIQSVYDDSVLDNMFTDGHGTKVKENPLNENYAKKEFQALWREINHKYAYTVKFDSNELTRLLNVLFATSEVPIAYDYDLAEDDANGYYNTLTKEIFLKSKISSLHKIKTVFHEYSHYFQETIFADKTKEMDRSTKEVIAESSAYCVMEMLSNELNMDKLDSSEYSFGYIASWGSRDLNELKSTLSLISKISNLIFDWVASKFVVS